MTPEQIRFNAIIGFITIGVIAGLKIYFRGGVCRVRRDLHGKVAVITGGNAGVGRETVKALIKQGCRVIFGARSVDKNR